MVGCKLFLLTIVSIHRAKMAYRGPSPLLSELLHYVPHLLLILTPHPPTSWLAKQICSCLSAQYESHTSRCLGSKKQTKVLSEHSADSWLILTTFLEDSWMKESRWRPRSSPMISQQRWPGFSWMRFSFRLVPVSNLVSSRSLKHVWRVCSALVVGGWGMCPLWWMCPLWCPRDLPKNVFLPLATLTRNKWWSSADFG